MSSEAATPPSQRKESVTHRKVQQDTESDDDDHHHHQSPPPAASQQQQHIPSPPSSTKKASPPHGNKKKLTTTKKSVSPASGRGGGKKDPSPSSSSLPPVVNKSTVKPEKSLTFEKKVAKHQFRDFDKGAPQVRTDPHPKELTTDRHDNLKAPRVKHDDDKKRRQSLAFEANVKKHQFREHDTKLPAFNTKVDANSSNNNDNGTTTAASNTNKQKGNDDDDNENSLDRKRSMAFQKKVALHQFRDLDATAGSVTSSHTSKQTNSKQGGGGVDSGDEFYVDARPHPLPNVYDTPEEREKRRKEAPFVDMVKHHQFRTFEPEDKLPNFVTKSSPQSARLSDEGAAKAKIEEAAKLRKEKEEQDEARKKKQQAKTARLPDRVAALATVTPKKKKNSNSDNNNRTPSSSSSAKKTPRQHSTTTSTPRRSQTHFVENHLDDAPAGATTTATATNSDHLADDHNAEKLKRGTSNTGSFGANNNNNNNNNNGGINTRRKSHVSAPTAQEQHIDSSFPRQPKCDPENLDVPVTRICDLLWTKYVIGDKKHGLFPIDKLMGCFAKIWPGNKLSEETCDGAVEAIVDERTRKKITNVEGAAASMMDALKEAAAASAGAGADANGDDDNKKKQQDAEDDKNKTPPTTTTTETKEQQHELPGDLLTHKEFMLVFKIVSTMNNWNCVLDPMPPKVMSLDDFALVADALKIEKPGKLFMELTDMKGDDLPYGRLAKHFAEKKKSGISMHLLQQTKSFLARTKHNEQGGGSDSDNDNNNATTGAAADGNNNNAPPAHTTYFPRQPKCDPDDLTLPTTRILGILFDKYSGHNESKRFPLSKLPVAISKIWPAHNIPGPLIDDAIDAVIGDRAATTAAEEQQTKGAQAAAGGEEEEEEKDNNIKDTCTLPEYIMCFRVVANLNNWRVVIPPDTPKFLELEPFAIVADKLRVEKPGKLFMELTNNGAKPGIPQAAFALYFSKKKKTFRFNNVNEDDDIEHLSDDDEGVDDDDGDDAADNKQNSKRNSRSDINTATTSTTETTTKRKNSNTATTTDKSRDFDSMKKAASANDEDDEIGLPGEKKATNNNNNNNKKKTSPAAAADFDDGEEFSLPGEKKYKPRTPTPPPPPVNDSLKQLKEIFFPTEMFALKASLCSFSSSSSSSSNSNNKNKNKIEISQFDYDSTLDSLVQCGAVRSAELDKAKKTIFVPPLAVVASSTSTTTIDITNLVECLLDKNDYAAEAKKAETAAVDKAKKAAAGPDGNKNFVSATVRMFSGCKDDQTSADVADVSKFGLPKVTGAAKTGGGACTNAMLSVLRSDPSITYGDLISKMLDVLREKDYTQIPQLSSSNEVDLNKERFSLIADKNKLDSGRNVRALFIGVNYTGQHADVVLDGCANDAIAWRKYMTENGWPTGCDNMRLLTDGEKIENVHGRPTKKAILEGMDWLVRGAKKGDLLFFHFSGHGSQLKSVGDTEEEDGLDETLVPCDYNTNGEIRDDCAFQRLIAPLPPGVKLQLVVDCCHSGTMFDLPSKFEADAMSMEALKSGRLFSTITNPKYVAKKFEAAAEELKEGIMKGIDFLSNLF